MVTKVTMDIISIVISKVITVEDQQQMGKNLKMNHRRYSEKIY